MQVPATNAKSAPLCRVFRAAASVAALVTWTFFSTGCAVTGAIHDAGLSASLCPEVDELGEVVELEEVDDLDVPVEISQAMLERYCWSIRTDFYHGPAGDPPVFKLIAKYWVQSRPGSTIVEVESPTYKGLIELALAEVMADLDSLDPSVRALVAR